MRRVDPLARRDRAGLGDRRHRHARDQVVAELRRLAGAGAADVHAGARAPRSTGCGAGEVLGAPADHDRQRRRLGAARPAADRRVQRRAPNALRQPPRECGRPRRHVHEEDARAAARPGDFARPTRVRAARGARRPLRRRPRRPSTPRGTELPATRAGRRRNRRPRGRRRRGAAPSAAPSSRGR